MSVAYLLLFLLMALVLSITTFTFMCIHCSSYIVHDCPVLTITNGMVSYQPPRTPPVVGATASYTCNTGYTLSGNNMRTCQEVNDGTWTGSDPSCNREFNLTFEVVTHCIRAHIDMYQGHWRCQWEKYLYGLQWGNLLFHNLDTIHPVHFKSKMQCI